MEIVFLVVGVLVGAAAGAWSYRYLLRKNPAAIDRLAEEARKLGDRF